MRGELERARDKSLSLRAKSRAKLLLFTLPLAVQWQCRRQLELVSPDSGGVTVQCQWHYYVVLAAATTGCLIRLLLVVAESLSRRLAV